MNARRFANLIHPIYITMDWKWKGRVPSERMIRECLKDLIEKAEADSNRYETGRLFALWDSEDKCVKFGLITNEYD